MSSTKDEVFRDLERNFAVMLDSAIRAVRLPAVDGMAG